MADKNALSEAEELELLELESESALAQQQLQQQAAPATPETPAATPSFYDNLITALKGAPSGPQRASGHLLEQAPKVLTQGNIGNALTAGIVPPSLAEKVDLGAAARGWTQGASYGAADELSGLLNEKISRSQNLEDEEFDWSQAFKASDPGLALDVVRGAEMPNYRRERDDFRAADKAAREESPISFEGGKLAGALMAPGPKGSGTLKSSIGMGALGGAAYGLGESDDLNPGEGLGSALMGAAGGALGHGLGKAGASMLKRIPASALRSLGITDEVLEQGFKDSVRGETRPLQRRLREGLESGDSMFAEGVTKSVPGNTEETTGELADALRPRIDALKRMESYPTEKQLGSFEESLGNEMLALKKPDGEAFYSGFPSERGWQNRANEFAAEQDISPVARQIADMIQQSRSGVKPPVVPWSQTSVLGAIPKAVESAIGPGPLRKLGVQSLAPSGAALQTAGEGVRAASQYAGPPRAGSDLLNQYLFGMEDSERDRKTVEREEQQAVRSFRDGGI